MCTDRRVLADVLDDDAVVGAQGVPILGPGEGDGRVAGRHHARQLSTAPLLLPRPREPELGDLWRLWGKRMKYMIKWVGTTTFLSLAPLGKENKINH